MSHEFVETGQTFTQDGAAYCPIERKRRGPGALAASLIVLGAGVGFLAYAMFSAPAPADAPAPIETASLTAPAVETPALTPSPAASDAAPAMSVEEALAESRAARAGLPTEENVEAVLSPRLKPSLSGATEAEETVETDLAPRLKPEQEIRSAAVATAPTVRRAKPRGVFLAAAEDSPPPFFFSSDIPDANAVRQPAALVYAGDLNQPYGQARIRITKGENFVDALKRAGVSAADRNEAAYAFGKHYNLRQLRPGQEFALTLGWPNQTLFQLASDDTPGEARLIGLDFRADPANRIRLTRDKKGALIGEKSVIPMTTRVLSVSGRIDGSLYLSAKAEGAPDQIIADLADAFAYDVDFQREIFGGDEFEAIFEAKYDDRGKLVAVGDIIYARLKWRGRSKEKGYYRFAEQDGRSDFYDATGQSAKRLLMKTPIDGARLSSRFGTRKHPILGYARAHKGVDFAAARGTPIKAAGDGVIERADRYGSFGNYVRIRHANGYQTAYAHLNGFARGIRKGKRVDQGDIIGYVGTTGRSTGPHLHYEVHLHGTAVNPQTLKIATGKELTGAELARFKAQRDMINAMRTPPEEETPLYAEKNNSGAGSQ